MIQNPCELKFLNYIKSLSSSWVFEYFLLESDSARKILSTNIIEKAVSTFIEPQNLIDKFNSLSHDERIRCSLIYLTGCAGFVCDTDDPLEHPLIRSFLVFAAKDQNENKRLFGFEEFDGILRHLCIKTIIENAHCESIATFVPQWKWRPLNDLIIIITLASQGVIKKGRNGRLSRAALQKIKRLTENSSGVSENSDYVAKMMITYCISKEILHEYDMGYRFNQTAFKNWMCVPLEERLSDCKNFTISYSGCWRIGMLQEVLNSAGASSIDLKIVPEQDKLSVLDTIRALRFAGIVEYTTVDDNTQISSVTQIDSIEKTENTALVQADFSAVIPQETDPDTLNTFAQLGELVSLDKVYKGKIEKKILGDSLSRGIDSDEILGWLSERQAPSNVLETVREWIREFFRLYISERMVLVSGDEKVSRQLESYEPLRSQLDIVRAHTIYQVKTGHEAQVREILGSLGFDYRKPGELKEDFGESTPAPFEKAPSLEGWKPVIDVRSEEKKKSGTMRGTKYGEELKELDMSEIIHVIDYAVLTGRNLTFDYEGSPYLKPGIYTVLPFSCRKGIEPVLEAEMLKTKSRKQFYIKKIKKIGVAAE